MKAYLAKLPLDWSEIKITWHRYTGTGNPQVSSGPRLGADEAIPLLASLRGIQRSAVQNK